MVILLTNRRVRREVYWNCGKAFATHLFICRLNSFSDSYANSYVNDSKESLSVGDRECNEGRLCRAKEAFTESVSHGIPIHIIIVLFKECQLLMKWVYGMMRYRYDMRRMGADEREFYASNWSSVWKEMTRGFVFQSGVNVATAFASILLQGIGMGISHFLFPHLAIQFNHSNLMCTISMLLYTCLRRNTGCPHSASPNDGPNPSNDERGSEELDNSAKKNAAITTTRVDNGTDNGSDSYDEQQMESQPGKMQLTIKRMSPAQWLTWGTVRKPILEIKMNNIPSESPTVLVNPDQYLSLSHDYHKVLSPKL